MTRYLSQWIEQGGVCGTLGTYQEKVSKTQGPKTSSWQWTEICIQSHQPKTGGTTHHHNGWWGQGTVPPESSCAGLQQLATLFSSPRPMFWQGTSLICMYKLSLGNMFHTNCKCARDWAQWGLCDEELNNLSSLFLQLSDTWVIKEGKGNLVSRAETGNVQADFHTKIMSLHMH